MFERADQLLSAAGYLHYEISNYALPGWRSRHNLHYWRHGEYLGFGAGAHAYLHGYRWENERLPSRYRRAIAERGSAAGTAEHIDGERRLHEGLMVGLRLQEGSILRPSHGRTVFPRDRLCRADCRANPCRLSACRTRTSPPDRPRTSGRRRRARSPPRGRAFVRFPNSDPFARQSR